MEAEMRNRLITDRLTLRQVQLDDAPAFAALASDLDIARMTSTFPYPFPLISAEFKILYLRANKRRGQGSPYAITLTGKDQLIGVVDLFHRTENAPLELAYWLGRPFWGQGLISEACRAILAEAERNFGSREITAGVYVDNLGSIRVLEKLGFVKTGTPINIFSMARLTHAPTQEYILKSGDAPK